MDEKYLLNKHEEILSYFLEYRKEHLNFTFSPRKKHNDIEHNHANCRLCRGYWFQGANNYIFTALYKRGCKHNKTKTIGFVFTENRQYIEIVFQNVERITDNEYKFYEELLLYLDKSENIKNVEKKNKKSYFYILKSINLLENLDYYLNNIKVKTDELIKKHSLEDKYFISNEYLEDRLLEINKIKNKSIISDGNNYKIKTKNIILYGAPGVGKTHNYKKLLSLIEAGDFKETDIFNFVINNKDDEIEEGSIERLYKEVKNEKRLEFISFHQSYSYEDFIEGFRPNEDGNIKLEDGIFKNIVADSLKQKEKNFYLVIDEINRGNISKIFGELITLIEEDKRDTYEVTLPYSKEPFKIPSNLYIIATMNSTDKSIATIDIALRRRFTFLKMKPNLALVENKEAKELMKKLNEFIGRKENLGEDYKLGHSYFMKVENESDLDFVKEYKIKPLIEEYFYADENKLGEILGILNND